MSSASGLSSLRDVVGRRDTLAGDGAGMLLRKTSSLHGDQPARHSARFDHWDKLTWRFGIILDVLQFSCS